MEAKLLSIAHNIAMMMRESVVGAGYGPIPMTLPIASLNEMYLVEHQRLIEGVIKGNDSPCKSLPLTRSSVTFYMVNRYLS